MAPFSARGDASAGTPIVITDLASRVAALEAQIKGQGQRLDGLDQRITNEAGRIDAELAQLRGELATLRGELGQRQLAHEQIDAKGLFPVTLGIVLTGVSDELAAWPWLAYLAIVAGVAAFIAAVLWLFNDWHEVHGAREFVPNHLTGR